MSSDMGSHDVTNEKILRSCSVARKVQWDDDKRVNAKLIDTTRAYITRI